MDVPTSIGVKKKGEGTDGIELEAITATSPIISAAGLRPLSINATTQSITNSWLANCCRGKCFTRRNNSSNDSNRNNNRQQSNNGEHEQGESNTDPKE